MSSFSSFSWGKPEALITKLYGATESALEPHNTLLCSQYHYQHDTEGLRQLPRQLHLWSLSTPGCKQVALLGVPLVRRDTWGTPSQQGPVPLSSAEIKTLQGLTASPGNTVFCVEKTSQFTAEVQYQGKPEMKAPPKTVLCPASISFQWSTQRRTVCELFLVLLFWAGQSSQCIHFFQHQGEL